MARLDDALVGEQQIGLDSSPIIYFVEAQPTYAPLMADLFQRMSRGQLIGTTSTITLVEVLTQPRAKGNVQLADAYRNLLLASAYLQTIPIDTSVAELAADLRASYGSRFSRMLCRLRSRWSRDARRS